MTQEELVERLNTVRKGMEAGLDDWPIASQIWEYKEAAIAIEQLTARITELERSEHWQARRNSDVMEQLLLTQAENKLLRDALLTCTGVVTKAGEGIVDIKQSYDAKLVLEALSLYASTEALDAYVAEKVKEYGDEARRQMQHATKAVWQRDLAVGALGKLRGMAPADDALQAIKESEEN